MTSREEELERMEERANRIEDVSGVCSQCGRLVLSGCEVGIIDDNGEAQAFCDYKCYAEWNKAHGLGPSGEARFEIWNMGHGCTGPMLGI